MPSRLREDIRKDEYIWLCAAYIERRERRDRAGEEKVKRR